METWLILLGILMPLAPLLLVLDGRLGGREPAPRRAPVRRVRPLSRTDR
jgi:hypothetical protein